MARDCVLLPLAPWAAALQQQQRAGSAWRLVVPTRERRAAGRAAHVADGEGGAARHLSASSCGRARVLRPRVAPDDSKAAH